MRGRCAGGWDGTKKGGIEKEERGVGQRSTRGWTARLASDCVCVRERERDELDPKAPLLRGKGKKKHGNATTILMKAVTDKMKALCESIGELPVLHRRVALRVCVLGECYG